MESAIYIEFLLWYFYSKCLKYQKVRIYPDLRKKKRKSRSYSVSVIIPGGLRFRSGLQKPKSEEIFLS